jgi:hypothetical protein
MHFGSARWIVFPIYFATIFWCLTIYEKQAVILPVNMFFLIFQLEPCYRMSTTSTSTSIFTASCRFQKFAKLLFALAVLFYMLVAGRLGLCMLENWTIVRAQFHRFSFNPHQFVHFFNISAHLYTFHSSPPCTYSPILFFVLQSSLFL